jgi:uncharacterized repeat protein (TIGR02543 family)
MPRIAVTGEIAMRGTLSQFYNAPTSNISLFNGTDALNYRTYPQQFASAPPPTNLRLGYYRTGTWLFWMKAVNTNGTKGTVEVTSPYSESNSGTNGEVGNGRQFLDSLSISFRCSVNYGYTFNGWYTAASGGTLVSSSSSVSIGATSTYINDILYARYN